MLHSSSPWCYKISFIFLWSFTSDASHRGLMLKSAGLDGWDSEVKWVGGWKAFHNSSQKIWNKLDVTIGTIGFVCFVWFASLQWTAATDNPVGRNPSLSLYMFSSYSIVWRNKSHFTIFLNQYWMNCIQCCFFSCLSIVLNNTEHKSVHSLWMADVLWGGQASKAAILVFPINCSSFAKLVLFLSFILSQAAFLFFFFFLFIITPLISGQLQYQTENNADLEKEKTDMGEVWKRGWPHIHHPLCSFVPAQIYFLTMSQK